MLENIRPTVSRWMLNIFIVQFRTYSLRVTQPPDSEILPLLIYKDAPSEATTVSSAPAHQSSQSQSEVEVSYLYCYEWNAYDILYMTIIYYYFSLWKRKQYKREQVLNHLLYPKIEKKFQKRSQVMKHYLQ